MSQVFFAAATAPSLVSLDANFTECYATVPLAAVLTASGTNLGINQTTPLNNLHIKGASGVLAVRFEAVTDGTLGFIGAASGLLSGAPTASLALRSEAGLEFSAAGNARQAMLTSAGYLLMGYTASNGAYKLQVNSQIFATSSTVATSDARYKENVAPISGALALVNDLQPVSFTWKPHAVHDFAPGRHAGFLAQDVARTLAGTGLEDTIVKRNSTTLPDGTVEEFFGLAEGNLIPILTRAIQELTARVAALEAP